METKKFVEIFKYIISNLRIFISCIRPFTTLKFEFVKAELGGFVAYFGVTIEALLITTIFFIFYPKYAIGDTKNIEKKGYSKWNNINWIAVGGLLRLYIYAARKEVIRQNT